MITPHTAGRYIGFTEAAENINFPTLYFENGRITQKHETTSNVGWHANAKKNHYRANINGTSAEKWNKLMAGEETLRARIENSKSAEEALFYKNQEAKLASAINNFLDNFRKGIYNPTDNDEQSVLFEATIPNEGHFTCHLSRSKLRQPNNRYNNEYAKDKLERAMVALNDLRKHNPQSNLNLIS